MMTIAHVVMIALATVQWIYKNTLKEMDMYTTELQYPKHVIRKVQGVYHIVPVIQQINNIFSQPVAICGTTVNYTRDRDIHYLTDVSNRDMLKRDACPKCDAIMNVTTLHIDNEAFIDIISREIDETISMIKREAQTFRESIMKDQVFSATTLQMSLNKAGIDTNILCQRINNSTLSCDLYISEWNHDGIHLSTFTTAQKVNFGTVELSHSQVEKLDNMSKSLNFIEDDLLAASLDNLINSLSNGEQNDK